MKNIFKDLWIILFVCTIPLSVWAEDAVVKEQATITADTSPDYNFLKKEIEALKKEVEELKAATSTGKEGEGEQEKKEGPSLSGFFDVSASDFRERDNPWKIGPFELDVSMHASEGFAAAGTLVFKDGAADVGVAFVDYHKYDHTISPRGRIFYEPGFHIQLGRFDIPFGLDYLYFATPDRETITPPLVTDYIMDGGWNDDGIRVYGTYKFLDYSFYTTNGFNKGLAYGGRLGLFPLRDPFRLHKEISDKLFETGISLAEDDSKEIFSKEETIIGYDIQFLLSQLEVRAEYIERKSFVKDLTRSGFYIALKYMFESLPLYSIAQYDEYQKTNFDRVKRVSFGFTYEFGDYADIKFEYMKFNDSNLSVFEGAAQDSTYSAKLVMSF